VCGYDGKRQMGEALVYGFEDISLGVFPSREKVLFYKFYLLLAG